MYEKRVIVEGLSTEYIDCEGGERVILFLHGWGGNAHSLWSLKDAVPTPGEYRMIFLSLPGFGGTEAPREDWSVSDYSHFVRAFLEKVNLGDVAVLVAHSFGGRISILGLGEGVLSSEKLVLLGSPAVVDTRLKRKWWHFLLHCARVVFSLPFLAPLRVRLQKKFRSTDYANAGPLRGTFARVVSEDLTSYARKIKVPTLLIWGDRDEDAPLYHGQALHAAIQGSRLEVLSGKGHFTFSEAPNEVKELIRDFIL